MTLFVPARVVLARRRRSLRSFSRGRRAASRFTAGLQCHRRLWWTRARASGRCVAAGGLRPRLGRGRGRARLHPGRRAHRSAVLRGEATARRHPQGPRARSQGHLRGVVQRGRRLRRRGHPPLVEARLDRHRGQEHHEREARPHPRRRHPDPRGSQGGARRRAHRGHAPEHPVPSPEPGEPVHARRRDRAGRSRATQDPARGPAPAPDARGPAARRRHRRSLQRPLRLPVRAPLLARSAEGPRGHALQDRTQAGRAAPRGRLRVHPRSP